MQHIHKQTAFILLLSILLFTIPITHAQTPTAEPTTEESSRPNTALVAVFLGAGVAIGASASAKLRNRSRKI